MNGELQSSLKSKINLALSHLSEELKKLRSGRANPAMLDAVMVEVYGQKQPIAHVARVMASDARSLVVTPYDPSQLAVIAAAIREDQSLGINPVDDGRVIRLNLPEMTSERREQIVKQAHIKAEECRVSLRNARHEILDQAKQAQKSSEMSEDDYKRFEQIVTKELDAAQTQIENQIKAKEEELRTV